MENRAGYYKNNLYGGMSYKSFYPSDLPPQPTITMDNDLITILIEANRQLGILEGISSQISDDELFLSMYVRKEALLSSQMEGTQATLDDIFNPDIGDNNNLEVIDVINYIKATYFAVERMKTLPLCGRFMCEIHEILMEGVRGQDKNPGEFRTSQNWIGASGSTIKTARYIPPNPQDMKAAISELEKYINSDDNLDPLIQIALIHYQFETIHPFLDGNGRIGRLLITLFLMNKEILDKPIIYVSYFLKRNRIEYYDRLMEVRNKGNYEQWVNFFVQAIYESAKDAITTIKKMSKLHTTNYQKILKVGKRTNTLLELLKYIESHPIIDIKKSAETFGLSYNTMKGMIDTFIECDILKLENNVQRNKNYVYDAYLEILRKDTEIIK